MLAWIDNVDVVIKFYSMSHIAAVVSNLVRILNGNL